MKKQNQTIQAAGFIAVFLALNFSLGSLLELPKNDLIEKGRFDPKLRWEEFYNLPLRSIDILFLGSSHSYRSFNPRIFDEASGKGPSFNMGSSAQTPMTAYFVLKEALKTQKPRILIYEIFFQGFESDKQFVNATYNLEFMRSRDVRAEFFLNGYEPSDWVYFLVPPLRYRLNTTNAVRLLLGKEVPYNEDFYAGAGYVENPSVVDEETLHRSPMFEKYSFEPGNLQEKHLAYFEKIIRLAEENGIRVIFVSSPLPEISRSKIANYGEIHDYFQKIAVANKIPYIDYNLIDAKERLFAVTDYKDADHLNKSGAEKISADLARRLQPFL